MDIAKAQMDHGSFQISVQNYLRAQDLLEIDGDATWMSLVKDNLAYVMFMVRCC